MMRFIDRVWAAEGTGRELEIKFARQNYGESWCDTEEHYIQIDPGHRQYAVALHEIAHLLEPQEDHGPRFMRRYIDLLVRYGRCHEFNLLSNAALYGIEVHED